MRCGPDALPQVCCGPSRGLRARTSAEDLCREVGGREAAEGFPMLLRAGLHKVKRMCHFYQKVALLSKNRDVGGVTRL